MHQCKVEASAVLPAGESHALSICECERLCTLRTLATSGAGERIRTVDLRITSASPEAPHFCTWKWGVKRSISQVSTVHAGAHAETQCGDYLRARVASTRSPCWRLLLEDGAGSPDWPSSNLAFTERVSLIPVKGSLNSPPCSAWSKSRLVDQASPSPRAAATSRAS